MDTLDFIDNEFETENVSDDEIRDEEHEELLRAVHMLDSMQRIKPPTRTELSLNVSEFDLAPVKDGAVRLRDLARSLETRGKAFDAEVAVKLRNLTKTTKTLVKPLEKSAADRIKRVVAYNNLKQNVERWDAIVQTNRVARTVVFPMEADTVKVFNTNQIIAGWKSQTPTPLEAALDEAHGRSKVYQEDKKKHEEFHLTLAELKEKRREMAKLRAQQSFQEAKNRRLKKIKSKSYHRLMRREKMRQQLHDFEALQKSDPEAALKQLEQLEKVRAEERMTLRHKSTGHWARSRLIRAKYDTQTQQQLAEQLAMSRELTKKLKTVDSSDEDEVEAKTHLDEASKKFAGDADNPWITVNPASEVDEFVSGYKKYWEEQNQKTEAVLKKTEKQALQNKDQKTLTDIVHQSDVNVCAQETTCTVYTEEEVENDLSCFNEPKSMMQDVKKNNMTDTNNENDECEKSEKVNFYVDRQMEDTTEVEMTSTSKFKVKRGEKRKCKEKLLQTSESKVRSTSKCWIVTPVSENTPDVNVPSEDVNISGEELPTRKTIEEQKNERTVKCDSRIKSFLASVLPDMSDKERKKKKKKKSAIDRMFEKVEHNMSVNIQSKLEKLKNTIVLGNDIDSDTEELKNDFKESDLGASLALNMKDIRHPKDDTELMEGTQGETNSGKVIEELVSKTSGINGSDGTGGLIEGSNKLPETNINPKNFIVAKPKVLLTAAPELITAGEEALDDEMERDQQMIISEAFADDDVVDDFRKEKQDEIEKFKPKDIDLSLPGWGDWGGIGIEMSTKKKKRFIIKAPPLPPRRDAEKSDVIINEEKSTGIKEHQVCQLPYSFQSVKEFEASIRAPIGATWVPQTAHKKLIQPAVITKMGQVIKPMSEEFLVNKKILEITD